MLVMMTAEGIRVTLEAVVNFNVIDINCHILSIYRMPGIVMSCFVVIFEVSIVITVLSIQTQF